MSSSSANLEWKEELLVVNAKEGRVGREVDMINNKNRPQTTKPFFVIFLCADQFESSTSPPRATPRAFEPLRIGLFKFPRLGAKKPFKCPTNSTELPLLKDKFLLQSNTFYAFQKEICRNDTFKLLLKTLLKELFTNKGEILSCKSVKPCKN